MITKKINIPCAWGGHLACILLKKQVPSTISQPTKKIIGIHGWLDNINSLFPVARRLVDQQSNYEVCLYDRAGHGFSGHFPRGTDYSFASNLLDLRTIIQNLGWNREKYSMIGHSYGGTLALIYAAAYPKEIASLAVLDPFAGSDYSSEKTWKSIATRIENNLQYFSQPPKTYKGHLTYEKAVELIKSSRIGIDDQSANLLVERSVRQDADKKLYFTRDSGLKNLQITPISHEIVTKAIERILAPILFLGTTEPQWPASNNLIPLLQSHNPNFEVFLVDGPHHFHMTHVDVVSDRIQQYFQKHSKE